MPKVLVKKDNVPLSTYREAYEKAKSEGRLARKTSRIHTWTEDTCVVIGKVMAIKPFKGGRFDIEVNAYLIETDEGMISCIFGTYTDSQLAGLDLIGSTIVIKYDGKKDLEDGRKVNLFNIDVIAHERGKDA